MKLLALFAVLGSACVHERELRAPPEPAPIDVAAPERAPRPLDEPSIYDLELALRSADDREIGLDVRRGHPVLITMFYATCPVACPVLIADVGRIASALPPAVQDDLRFVIVSFDPRDTPEKLRELASSRHLDDRWTVANASDLDARTLAAALGFKYRKLPNGEYMHGSTIVALDAEGRPIARTEKLGHHEPILAALR